MKFLSLVSLLAGMTLAGGLTIAKPALAQIYDVAEIRVSLADGITPAPGKLVELDFNNDLVYDTSEFTDGDGVALFLNVVSVEDSDGDGLIDSWELEHFGGVDRFGAQDDPDGDGLSNLREYQWGSNPTLADLVNTNMRLAMGKIKGNVNFASPKVDFFANVGEDVFLGVYDVRGRLVSRTSGVGDLSVSLPSGVADGKYFALLRSENDVAVASFITFGGVRSLSASRLSLDDAVSQGIVAEKSFDKSESQLMNIRISGEGYNTEVHQEDVVAGVNVFSYMLTPSGRSLVLKAFNISGTEALSDGVVTVSRGAFSQTASADANGHYSFMIPTDVDSLEFAVDGFLGYDHSNQVFSVLHPDSVAVRGFLGDDVRPMAATSMPDTAYIELVPEERLNDPLFMESVSKEGIKHWGETTRFYKYPNTFESDFTVPANALALNKLETALNNYVSILNGGAADGLALNTYSITNAVGVPSWDFQDMLGRWDVWVDNSAATPYNVREDWNGDGDIDNAVSSIRNTDSQGNANNEIAGPTVLYDNQINSTISGISSPDGGFSEKGIDLINTAMKLGLGRYLD